MVEYYTKEQFSEHLNTKFRIPIEPPEGVEIKAVELELVEVVSTISTPRQEQFSIYFLGPLNIFVPQGTYRLEHDQMGAIEVFIVPIAQEQNGYRYEAVFNRALEES